MSRPDPIRWRGGAVSRVEAFSDAVFAFAIALLVVSLDVPGTYRELERLMLGFVGFAGCFALLVMIWHTQYRFFRRFGLEDTRTIVLNAMLLFVILFYIYPLKFISNFLVGLVFGFRDGLGPGDVLPLADGVRLMIVYAVGYIAVFGLFALLYRRAWMLREHLALSPYEAFVTRATMLGFLVHVAVAALSASVAVVFRSSGPWALFLSGMSYALIGPGYMLHDRWFERELRRRGLRPEPTG